MSRRIVVRVPATSANLGPGFDCLGLALNLWNETVFTLEGERLQLSNSGEGLNIPTDERNLVVQAMRFFCDERGLPFPRGVQIRCHNEIPLGSGLGSSAAAVITGLLGASALLDQPLDTDEVLALSARMEGHADNAAAALLGGLVIVAAGRSGWITRRVAIPDHAVALVLPDVNLPTHAARAALPTEVSMKDATFNLGRAILVVEALRAGDLDLLRQAVDDRLHLPYRLPLIPGGQDALEDAYTAGARAVTISGAGPSLIAFTENAGAAEQVAAAMTAAFLAQRVVSRAFLLHTTQQGASVSGS